MAGIEAAIHITSIGKGREQRVNVCVVVLSSLSPVLYIPGPLVQGMVQSTLGGLSH